jgi:hypothetical protein
MARDPFLGTQAVLAELTADAGAAGQRAPSEAELKADARPDAKTADLHLGQNLAADYSGLLPVTKADVPFGKIAIAALNSNLFYQKNRIDQLEIALREAKSDSDVWRERATQAERDAALRDAKQMLVEKTLRLTLHATRFHQFVNAFGGALLGFTPLVGEKNPTLAIGVGVAGAALVLGAWFFKPENDTP